MGFNVWFKNTGNQPATGGLLSSGTVISPGLTPLAGGANSSNGLSSPLELPNQMPTLIGAQALQPAFNLVFTTAQAAELPISATLSLLSSRGFAKTLAEPTLVALSGQDASFLAGGEFPIPMAAGLGVQSAQFKKYGIQLGFTPFVLGDDAIQLRLHTTVSEIDFAVAVNISGGSVPGLKTRDSSTTIRLRNGQSFAIAGLLSDTMNSLVDKLPGIGDLPIIGALFRSTRFQRNETELLVVVTAHLVTPVGEGERIRLPGEDEISDPSDLELFLFGTMESHSAAPAGRVGYMR
jgi:pilus assembly protein CpaC